MLLRSVFNHGQGEEEEEEEGSQIHHPREEGCLYKGASRRLGVVGRRVYDNNGNIKVHSESA